MPMALLAVVLAGCGDSLTVTESEPPESELLEIVTTSLPEGTVGESYSATLEASGGETPYRWDVASGSLPVGLSLSSGGVISGTPTAGSRTFTVRVTGANELLSTRQLSLEIRAPATTVDDLGMGFGAEQFSLIPAGTFQMGARMDSPGSAPSTRSRSVGRSTCSEPR